MMMFIVLMIVELSLDIFLVDNENVAVEDSTFLIDFFTD